ncbi:peptidase inhibitor family I36 protein [Streptomyces sp. NPDC017993]|uniref:peptidase inhibitor family I36 protein n=1 Tax=Streptomyces sp. NPDC017993 TaxID=3365027 RepID=UPI0037AF65A7
MKITSVKQGQGLEACQAGQFCLYENENYNASGSARIWIFAPDAGKQWEGWNFNGLTVANRGRSAANNLAEHDVCLYDNWSEPQSTDCILMERGDRLPSLNNVSSGEGGRKIEHNGTLHDGGPAPEPHGATVHMNNRLGSITTTKNTGPSQRPSFGEVLRKPVRMERHLGDDSDLIK